MNATPKNLETRYRWVLAVVVMLFGGAFALGLLAYMLNQESGASRVALHAGLLLLMASPAVRMAVATADRIRRRDWRFLMMTAVVAVELSIVLWRAASRS